MYNIGSILIIVVIIALVTVMTCVTHSVYMDECTEFAKKKGRTIVRSDTHSTPIGTPFYYVNEGTMIYEIELDNGEVWFMRPSIFGNQWEKGE